MPILRNTNTLVADNGGGRKTTTTYKPYGSQYGGASAGNTGSSLGLYGSNYGGASTKPATTSTRTTTSSTTASNGRTSGSTGTVANSAINAGKTVINNAKNIANQYAGSGGSSGGYSGGSSGGSSGSSGGSGGGGGSSSTNDDYLNKIIGYLEEQKRASDAYYKEMLERALSDNQRAYRDDQDQINLNYLRADRFLKNRYGDALTGTGLSNRSRNDLNWNKLSATNRQNYTNNDATARADYNRNLANSASTLAQGWYNYVMPVYSARQQNLDYLNYLSSMM